MRWILICVILSARGRHLAHKVANMTESPTSAPTQQKRRAVEVMTLEHEKHLWEVGILNLTDSLGLSRATYFYFCKAFGVFSRNAIREVIREQFRFGEDEIGKYVEFVDFEKPHSGDAGGTIVQQTRRVRQYDDPNNNFSIYKIMATYMKYIPPTGVFFCRPLSPCMECPKPIQFSTSAIGINTLSHYLSDIMKSAGFVKEYFTPQSIKSSVLSVLFRVGVDEELTKQRTRWWLPGRVSLNYALAGPSPSGLGALKEPGKAFRSQSDRQKVLTISRLLDPPPFTLHRVPMQELETEGIVEVQDVDSVVECPSAADSTPRALNVGHPGTSIPAQVLLQRVRSSHPQQELGELRKWFSEESSYGADSDSEEEYIPKKRPRFVPLPKSSDGSGPSTSGAHGEFVALSGPVVDSCPLPKQITKAAVVKEERDYDDDDDCCVVASSIVDRPLVRHEQQANSATNQTAASSTSSSRQDLLFHDKSHPGVRNQMQCLTNSEMKEAASRPPKKGTSSLSLAFKFSYEIDHNGEVAASREIRALHTTVNPDASVSVKRRLLPLNVVDSSGQEAAERQEELPNFSIKLSDFFSSISHQKIDIRDVVIRGTRGQGTDRLNVELVVAERNEDEREVLPEQFNL